MGNDIQEKISENPIFSFDLFNGRKIVTQSKHNELI
jgi:hypothetical protein